MKGDSPFAATSHSPGRTVLGRRRAPRGADVCGVHHAAPHALSAPFSDTIPQELDLTSQYAVDLPCDVLHNFDHACHAVLRMYLAPDSAKLGLDSLLGALHVLAQPEWDTEPGELRQAR